MWEISKNIPICCVENVLLNNKLTLFLIMGLTGTSLRTTMKEVKKSKTLVELQLMTSFIIE